MQHRRRSLPILLVGPVLLSLASGCYRPRLAVAGPEGCGDAPAARVTRAINAARAERGRSPLRPDGRLSAAARRHSADMARHRYMGHRGRDGSTFTLRALDAGYDLGSVGEVVAAGQRSPEAAVTGWLHSRRHRAILLLDDIAYIGAACAASSRGSLYWTAVVGKSRAVAAVADRGVERPRPR